MFMVHFMLTSNSMMEEEEEANHHGHISEKVTPPQEESRAGPSGRIPEEGIDIVGEDSSMQVIAPEDPPVGQDMEVEDSDFDDPDPLEA
jgi:hypothetical protein